MSDNPTRKLAEKIAEAQADLLIEHSHKHPIHVRKQLERAAGIVRRSTFNIENILKGLGE